MVPNGWKEVKLGDVISHQKGFAFKSEHYCDEGKRIIRISDTDRNSIHDKSPVYINDNNSFGLERYVLSAGDIILSTVGSRPHLLYSMVGKAVQIPPKDEGSLLNQNLVKISPKKKLITNNYLFSMLKKNKFNFFISTLVRGNANQVSITLNELFSYKFLLPTYDEQRKIAKILSTWDKAIATTEQLIAASQQQKKALMQQLLTGKKRLVDPETGKAFEGGWEEVKLNKCVKFLNGQRKPIKQEDRANIQGKYPYYGATGIIDYVNDYIFDDEIILLGEDGENILSRVLPHVFVVRGKVWVNNHAHVLKANANMDTNFLCMYLESLDYKRYNSGSAQPKINKAVCEKIPVVVPVLAEQQKIASVLTAADKEIELLVAKLAHLKEEKKALMQQLLTGKRRVKIEHMEEATC
ncbi:restriction endonuclease subunit S [Vibrio cholerae]|nr:restriction endonuclease subunit S [Vibrio cholerae]